MIGKKVKNLIPVFAFLFLIATLSSCNRGMGCPTFSLEKTVTTVVQQVPAIVCNAIK